MNDNLIYRRQLALLTFFMSITYKIVMLPKYLAMGAIRDFFLGMAVAMLIEMVMFRLVYIVVDNRKHIDMYANIWVLRIVYIMILLSSVIKYFVLSVETLDYISSLLFQEGRWLFIILTLLPAIGYISYKGANNIARLSEIVVWAVLITFAFTLIFLKADVSLDNMLPIFDKGVDGTIKTFLMHSIWFGDFVPFCLLELDMSDTRLDRIAPNLGIVATYILTMGFYLLFLSIYGDIAPYIKYAFSNIGIYNRISNMLGGVDFPIVCVWMLMAIIKLAFLTYTMRVCLIGIVAKHESKKMRIIVTLIITIVPMLILSFAIKGTDMMYDFATSSIRWVVLAVDYIAVIIMIVLALLAKKKYIK